jgi:predicted nucleic-acid-binding protein
VKIMADTNVLARAIVSDDQRQARIAQRQLARAESVALTLPVLCELHWVLSRGYKISSSEIARAIRLLIDSPTSP